MKPHVVRPHDTLIGILKQLHMNPGLSKALARFNGISNEDLIYQGQVIKVPDEAALARWSKKGEAGNGPPPGGGGAGQKGPHGAGKPGPSGSGQGNGRGMPRKGTAPPRPPKKSSTPSKAPAQVQDFVHSLSIDELLEMIRDGRKVLAFGRRSASGRTSRLPKNLGTPELIQLMTEAEQQAFDKQAWTRKGTPLYTEDSYPVPSTEPARDGVRLKRDQLYEAQLKGMSN